MLVMYCLVDNENGRGRKKRRSDSETSLPAEDRLEAMIVRIGDKSASPLEKNIDDLAQILNEDAVRSKANIIRILCEW